jgi:hypothetical protein
VVVKCRLVVIRGYDPHANVRTRCASKDDLNAPRGVGEVDNASIVDRCASVAEGLAIWGQLNLDRAAAEVARDVDRKAGREPTWNRSYGPMARSVRGVGRGADELVSSVAELHGLAYLNAISAGNRSP